jgi:hypothetical protein
MVESLGVVVVSLFVGMIVWVIRSAGSINSEETPETLEYGDTTEVDG